METDRETDRQETDRQTERERDRQRVSLLLSVQDIQSVYQERISLDNRTSGNTKTDVADQSHSQCSGVISQNHSMQQTLP